MKNLLPFKTKGVYDTPNTDVLIVVTRSVILGSNGSTQNYDEQNPWDTPDNE